MKNLKILHKNTETYPRKYKNFGISDGKVVFFNTKDDTLEVNLSDCEIITDEIQALKEEHKELYEIVTHPDVIEACENEGLNIDFNGKRVATGKVPQTTSENTTVINEYHENESSSSGVGDFVVGAIAGALLCDILDDDDCY